MRKYRDADQLPSQIERAERSYRTREDPLSEYWDEITAILERDPRLKPYAILDWLKQKYNLPEGQPRVSDSIRRTLERRVQSWKLQHGVEQEVKFSQIHHPGDVIAFDFVVLNSLKVTLDGKPFDHMLFHAVFTYSNWEYVHLCHSESFEALSAGLQDALHLAGGVRIHQDHLELWYRNECLERMPRLFGYGKEGIDFRHVIDSLVRKPGAFVNYKYVNHMYPTTRFRMA